MISSGGHFVQQIRTICAVLVEGIMGSIHFKFRTEVQDMSFKDFS